MSESDSVTIMTKTETTTQYDMTVRQIAEAFMNMDSERQAEFFTHCKAIEQEWKAMADPNSFCMPAMQWFYVRDHLKDGRYDQDSGWEFVMDLAAPFYVYFSPGFLGQ